MSCSLRTTVLEPPAAQKDVFASSSKIGRRNREIIHIFTGKSRSPRVSVKTNHRPHILRHGESRALGTQYLCCSNERGPARPPSVYLSLRMFVPPPSVCLSHCPSICSHPSDCPTVHLSVLLLIYLPYHLPVRLSISSMSASTS